MTTAEKLTRLKTDFDDVYNRGYIDGKAEGGTQKEEQEKSITITENGTTEVLPDTDKTLSKVTVEVDVPSSGGGIDLISYVLTPPSMSSDLGEVTEDLVFHLERAISISNMFSGVGFSCSKLTLYISNKCTSFFRAVRLGPNCKLKEIEIIGDTSNVTTFNAAFDNKVSLERIIGEIDFSSSINNGTVFGGCKALQQFTPKPNTIKSSISFSNSPNLTDETLWAIAYGLADLTGQDAQTVKFHPEIITKLTDEQMNTILNKNWTFE